MEMLELDIEILSDLVLADYIGKLINTLKIGI